MALLLKNNITYTMTLSTWYFITSLILLAGIVYTLRRGIMHAKRLSKASVMSSNQTSIDDDMDNFREHLSNPEGLF